MNNELIKLAEDFEVSNAGGFTDTELDRLLDLLEKHSPGAKSAYKSHVSADTCMLLPNGEALHYDHDVLRKIGLLV